MKNDLWKRLLEFINEISREGYDVNNIVSKAVSFDYEIVIKDIKELNKTHIAVSFGMSKSTGENVRILTPQMLLDTDKGINALYREQKLEEMSLSREDIIVKRRIRKTLSERFDYMVKKSRLDNIDEIEKILKGKGKYNIEEIHKDVKDILNYFDESDFARKMSHDVTSDFGIAYRNIKELDELIQEFKETKSSDVAKQIAKRFSVFNTTEEHVNAILDMFNNQIISAHNINFDANYLFNIVESYIEMHGLDETSDVVKKYNKMKEIFKRSHIPDIGDKIFTSDISYYKPILEKQIELLKAAKGGEPVVIDTLTFMRSLISYYTKGEVDALSAGFKLEDIASIFFNKQVKVDALHNATVDAELTAMLTDLFVDEFGSKEINTAEEMIEAIKANPKLNRLFLRFIENTKTISNINALIKLFDTSVISNPQVLKAMDLYITDVSKSTITGWEFVAEKIKGNKEAEDIIKNILNQEGYKINIKNIPEELMNEIYKQKLYEILRLDTTSPEKIEEWIKTISQMVGGEYNVKVYDTFHMDIKRFQEWLKQNKKISFHEFMLNTEKEARDTVIRDFIKQETNAKVGGFVDKSVYSMKEIGKLLKENPGKTALAVMTVALLGSAYYTITKDEDEVVAGEEEDKLSFVEKKIIENRNEKFDKDLYKLKKEEEKNAELYEFLRTGKVQGNPDVFFYKIRPSATYLKTHKKYARIDPIKIYRKRNRHKFVYPEEI